MNFAIKAKKAIKKVAAMSVGAAMVGSTLFGAAAADLADYPEPFVEDGLWNTVIVVGADAAASDIAGAIDISATLSQQATTVYTTSTTTTTVAGGVNLASGDDKIFFGDTIGDAGLTTLTEDDFPTLLADSTFTDDGGTDYDYTQKIDIGDSTFDFSTSGNDLDDPALLIDLGTNPNSPVYTFTIDFDEAVNFSYEDSIGEEFTIFGKTYTIGSETSNTKIQLLGGALPVSLDWGETKTVTFSGDDYEITLVGVQDESGGNEATIRINGDTETIAQGATKKIGGVDVYADQVNYYGLDAYPGDCIISLGADELWLEDGAEVAVGSDEEEIDNTDITITSSPEEVSQIQIAVAAQDNDFDHIVAGESFTDPVFGTIKVSFVEAVNGPTITEVTGVDTNTARRVVDITAADADTLQLEITDSNGNAETFEWANDDTPGTDNDAISLADSDGNTFALYEGATLDEPQGDSGGATYTVLNSNGEYSGLIEIDNLDDDDSDAIDLDIKDVITGDTIVNWDNQNLTTDTKTFTFRGKTYTVACLGTDSGITIADSTTAKTNVYPYIELFSGYDHRVAFVDEIATELIDAGINSSTTENTSDATEGTYILPTGTVEVHYNDSSNVTDGIWVTEVDDTVLGYLTASAATNVTVGSVDYTFTCGALADQVQCNFSGVYESAVPGLLIVEELDDADVANSVWLAIDDDGGGASTVDITIEAPDFSDGTSADNMDDSDLSAYVDEFGVYALLDTAGDQDQVRFTIPQQQMYASVYVAPEEATTTTTSTGEGVTIHSVSGVDVAKLDTEVTDKTAKPMILVGGPCKNDLVAELAADGDFRYGCVDWPGSNFGIIEIAENAFGGSNVAMVIAGTTAADTRRAAKVVKDYSDYSLSGMSMKVTGTQTSPVVEPYVEETE